MKNAVFVDSGAFIALVNKADGLHAQARTASEIVESVGRQVTTPFVLLEACTYLQRRVNGDAGRKLWASILSGEAEIDLLPIEARDLKRAEEIAALYSDQSFSWVDCTSFACIERLKISRVFSFDKDFLIYKFSHGLLHLIQ
jgi:predicted nucleic acid-binding protein